MMKGKVLQHAVSPYNVGLCRVLKLCFTLECPSCGTDVPVQTSALLEHQIDLLHEEEEPTRLRCERDELVFEVEIARPLFRVHHHRPARNEL